MRSSSAVTQQRLRRHFFRSPSIEPLPNLIELQRQSYEDFLQYDIPPELRKETGIEGAFRTIFPIYDNTKRLQLEFCSYTLEEPKHDLEECRHKGLTYFSLLRVKFRLTVWDVDSQTGVRSIQQTKEQEIYIAEVPLMTETGAFVINGADRVIVSQMHRSPGVFFDHNEGKAQLSGKQMFSARVIPYRGSWIDIEFDAKDLLFIRIDRKRKILATTFLKILPKAGFDMRDGSYGQPGMDDEEILKTFYKTDSYCYTGQGWLAPFKGEEWLGYKTTFPFLCPETGEIVLQEGTKINSRTLKKLEASAFNALFLKDEQVKGMFLARDIVNMETGEILFSAGSDMHDAVLEWHKANPQEPLELLRIDGINVGPYLRNTLVLDRCVTREEALLELMRALRPGEPVSLDTAQNIFKSLFFDEDRYDLSAVGRVKMNARLGRKTDDSLRVLEKDDIVRILQFLLELRDGRGYVDDIDSLSNRRVRSCGELVENQFLLGLQRTERAIKERLNAIDPETALPADCISSKTVNSSLREFFASSQLSQFMDQTNPLSEISHKRRLSALGPGGLSRDRVNFEVRDVHPTHYGRICPVETPEGQNIGLINSLATYARVNQYGFIKTPYKRVCQGRVTDEVIYLSAIEEERCIIAQATELLKEDNTFKADMITCRQSGDYVDVTPDKIDYIGLSPNQILSVAASLIPFVENDDANRALMGANMQRQAVPLISPQAPLVGTGIEEAVAKDSGALILAKRSGIVDEADASRIVVRAFHHDDDIHNTPVDIYTLSKFKKSNANTCINHKPLVHRGQVVGKGDIIADGPSTNYGELSLGRNVVVAFLSYYGKGFEDSIVVSQRLVRENAYTSLHIEELELSARDTRLGPEEITRDIPHVQEELLRHIDESGIAYIGAKVKPGDILVGKVSPNTDAPITPEEKLLRAIFLDKATSVIDTSLKVPPGIEGTVVDIKVLTRSGLEKDDRTIALERHEIERLSKDKAVIERILERGFLQRLKDLLVGQSVEKLATSIAGISVGDVLTRESLESLAPAAWKHITVLSESVAKKIEGLKVFHSLELQKIQKVFEQKVEKINRGDELPAGVLKVVKVYIAMERNLQPGDKMSGRHGNKGVVSSIVPEEDMPFLEDGTPVDIVLNPLGVPSRMNLGQIFETHLGLVGKTLGSQVRAFLAAQEDIPNIERIKEFLKDSYESNEAKEALDAMEPHSLAGLTVHLAKAGLPMASHVFEGASAEEIGLQLERAGLPASGKLKLFDGRTGEQLDLPVTVGVMHMLKLHHLVDDKIHARSTGSYSLITQQPLGGKAQFGGQRFGEMEVWALEAYGAANILREILTIKSDDVAGRMKAYDNIVKGEPMPEPGIPESFKVLQKELNALAIRVNFIN